jgi:hypothetical protein
MVVLMTNEMGMRVTLAFSSFAARARERAKLLAMMHDESPFCLSTISVQNAVRRASLFSRRSLLLLLLTPSEAVVNCFFIHSCSYSIIVSWQRGHKHFSSLFSSLFCFP